MRFESWAFGPGWQGLTATISSAHEKYQAAFDNLNSESPQQTDDVDSDYGQKLLKLETDLQTEITVALERYSHRLQVCRLAIHDYLLWRAQADQEFDTQLERIEAQRTEGIAQIEAQRPRTWGEFGGQQPSVAT